MMLTILTLAGAERMLRIQAHAHGFISICSHRLYGIDIKFFSIITFLTKVQLKPTSINSSASKQHYLDISLVNMGEDFTQWGGKLQAAIFFFLNPARRSVRNYIFILGSLGYCKET